MLERRLVPATFACLVLSACGAGAFEFADWVLPVPEGAKIVQYAAVQPAQRTGRIQLIADLVIGAGDQPEGRLYRPVDVAVSDSGEIYIADSGQHRILAFDEQGAFLRAFGREGEGPGEFQGGARMRITVVDDRVVVNDARDLSVWSLEGEFLDDATMDVGPFDELQPGAERSVVARYEHVSDVTSPAELVARHALDGRELLRYASVAKPGSLPYTDSMNRWVWIEQAGVNRAAGPTLGVATDHSGAVYVSPLVEYQVLRMNASGSTDWALRVAWPRPAYSDELIERHMDSLRERAPDSIRQDIDWPERQRALDSVETDGHGHLYVIPIRDLPPGVGGGGVLVDVYSDRGDQLFSGYMPEHVGDLWWAAHGGFVYDLRSHEATGEYELVRYRLVEPFGTQVEDVAQPAGRTR